MYGLTLEEASGEPVGVWPDNWPAVNAFISMSTQWRAGMAGATGLDYNALPAVLRMTQIPRRQWPEIFQSIRILEDAAMETMRSSKQ